MLPQKINFTIRKLEKNFTMHKFRSSRISIQIQNSIEIKVIIFFIFRHLARVINLSHYLLKSNFLKIKQNLSVYSSLLSPPSRQRSDREEQRKTIQFFFTGDSKILFNFSYFS